MNEVTKQHGAYLEVTKRLNEGMAPRELRNIMQQMQEEITALRESNVSHERRIKNLETVVEALSRRVEKFINSQGYQEEYTDKKTVKAICEEFLSREYPDVSWDAVLSLRRNNKLNQARRACVRIAYETRPDLSLPALGRIFRRDHTTIYHALNTEVGYSPKRAPDGKFISSGE